MAEASAIDSAMRQPTAPAGDRPSPPDAPAGAALVVPGVGQVVNLENVRECAQALEALRGFEEQIKEAKAVLTDAIIEESKRVGAKTIFVDGVGRVEVRGGKQTLYDAQALEEDLRALGCPEERIREAIKEEVTYKVDGRVVKQLAAANEEYAAVVESARQEVERASYVLVKSEKARMQERGR
jgi:hypothetical protein